MRGIREYTVSYSSRSSTVLKSCRLLKILRRFNPHTIACHQRTGSNQFFSSLAESRNSSGIMVDCFESRLQRPGRNDDFRGHELSKFKLSWIRFFSFLVHHDIELWNNFLVNHIEKLDKMTIFYQRGSHRIRIFWILVFFGKSRRNIEFPLVGDFRYLDSTAVSVENTWRAR